MELKESSPFSLLASFYRRIDLPIDGFSVDSRRKIRDYAVREINFFLWFALIFFTAFLVKKLVTMFDLRLKGDPMHRSPSPSILAWDNPREDLTGKRQ